MKFEVNVSTDIDTATIGLDETTYVATLPVKIRWSEADQTYVGTFHSLGDCCHADSEEEVLSQLKEIAESWFLSSLTRVSRNNSSSSTTMTLSEKQQKQQERYWQQVQYGD